MVRKLICKIPHKRFITFCIGGGLGAVINWVISFFLTTVLGIYYVLSYTLAQSVNITFNFLWNRHITFKIKTKAAKRFIKFLLVSSSTAALSILLVYLIKELVVDNIYTILIFNHDLNYLAAIIIVTFVVAVVNYLLNKLWVFEVK